MLVGSCVCAENFREAVQLPIKCLNISKFQDKYKTEVSDIPLIQLQRKTSATPIWIVRNGFPALEG